MWCFETYVTWCYLSAKGLAWSSDPVSRLRSAALYGGLVLAGAGDVRGAEATRALMTCEAVRDALSVAALPPGEAEALRDALEQAMIKAVAILTERAELPPPPVTGAGAGAGSEAAVAATTSETSGSGVAGLGAALRYVAAAVDVLCEALTEDPEVLRSSWQLWGTAHGAYVAVKAAMDLSEEVDAVAARQAVIECEHVGASVRLLPEGDAGSGRVRRNLTTFLRLLDGALRRRLLYLGEEA